MADDLKVRGLIEILLRGKGGTDAKKQMDAVDAGAKKAKKSLDQAGKSASSFGKKIVAAFSVGIVTRFAARSLDEAAQLERAYRSLGQQLERLGFDSATVLPQIRKHLEEVEAAGGPLRQELIPTFQRFVGITKDVEAALFLVGLTADLTEAQLGDAATNATRLANLLQGEATEAAKAFGIQLRDSSGAVKSNSELLQELQQQFGGFGSNVDDSGKRLSQWKAVWNEVTIQAGKGVDVLFSLVGGVESVVKVVKSAGPAIHIFGTSAGAVFTSLGKSIAAAFDLKKLFREGPGEFLRGITRAGQQAFDQVAGFAEDSVDKLREIWAEGGEEAGRAHAEGMKVAEEVADRNQLERQQRLAKQEADREAERLKKVAEERLQFEQKIADEALAVRIRTADQGSREQFDAEIEMLERLRARALKGAEARGADVALVNELFDQMEAERSTAFLDEQDEKAKERAEERSQRTLELDRALFEAELELLGENEAERLQLLLENLEKERDQEIEEKGKTKADIEKINKIYAAREKKITQDLEDFNRAQARETKRVKQQQAIEIAEQSIALGRVVFGESKALAIAGVVVSTARAVMSVWERWAAYPPVAAALTALTIATGAAQIAKIQSAQIGGGSISGGGASGGGASVGVGDGLASAASAVNVPAPVGDLSGASSTSITNIQNEGERREQHVHFHGTNIIDERSLRRFMRKARAVERRDLQTRRIS